MNKKQLALLQAARISTAVWEKAGKEDVTEDDFKADIEDYTATQLQYWKDKHPDFTPEKLKEQEKNLRNEGEARAVRKMLKDFGLTEAEVKGKTPEEVAALALSKVKTSDPTEAQKAADEWKSKAIALQVELEKINTEVIPGIHNEYKGKETESKRMEELLKPFTKLPVLDEYREDFTDILLKRISKTGIEAKLNDKGQLEYFEADGTRAKNQKTGKDLTHDDFVELVKPNLKGYIKESNGNPNQPKPDKVETQSKVSTQKERLLKRNEEIREATLQGKAQ